MVSLARAVPRWAVPEGEFPHSSLLTFRVKTEE